MKSLAIFLSLCILALYISADAAFTDRQTRRHIFHDRPYAPPNWQLVARAKPQHLHTITIALVQRNLDLLKQKYEAVSDPDSEEYGNFLTKEEILDIVKPDPSVFQKVSFWLRKNGVKAITNWGDSIRVIAPVSIVEELLQTKLYTFEHKNTDQVLVRNLGPYSIPFELKSLITMITGVSDFVPERPSVQKTKGKKVGDTDGLIITATLQALYNIPTNAQITTSSSQAPIEFQGYAAVSFDDESDFSRQTKTPAPQAKPTIVGPFYGVGIESTLDYQYITAIGQNAVNFYWTESDWLYDFSQSFFQAKSIPLVISLSWGWSEEDQCTIDTDCSNMGIDSEEYVRRVNIEFQKIGLRGVTIVAASGDSGANGRTDEECSYPGLRPDFPAASPYLVSVGATELNPVTKTSTTAAPVCGVTPCALGGTEVAVSFSRSYFASGGGFSDVEPQPIWQQAAVSRYLKSGVALPPASYFNATGRAYPDIAALGHNYVIVANSQVEQVGGTSASAPVIAGFIALLNDYRLKRGLSPLGPFNPLLYKLVGLYPSVVFDTTVGDNKCTEAGCSDNCQGFLCYKGWDPVTGWGSPNYTEMLKYISKLDDERLAKKAKSQSQS